jgi:hypothetical protein
MTGKISPALSHDQIRLDVRPASVRDERPLGDLAQRLIRECWEEIKRLEAKDTLRRIRGEGKPEPRPRVAGSCLGGIAVSRYRKLDRLALVR